MALTTSLKSRRKSRNAPTQAPAQQFLKFEIAQHQFALPITQVLKVIPLTTIYGDPTGRGIGLVNYQGQEILVLDIEKFLLPHRPSSRKTPYQFLLILQSADPDHSEPMGIPILAPPQLIRIQAEQITPLPKNYLSWGEIHGVSTLLVPAQAPTDEPLFLIDVNQILSHLSFVAAESEF